MVDGSEWDAATGKKQFASTLNFILEIWNSDNKFGGQPILPRLFFSGLLLGT